MSLLDQLELEPVVGGDEAEAFVEAVRAGS